MLCRCWYLHADLVEWRMFLVFGEFVVPKPYGMEKLVERCSKWLVVGIVLYRPRRQLWQQKGYACFLHIEWLPPHAADPNKK